VHAVGTSFVYVLIYPRDIGKLSSSAAQQQQQYYSATGLHLVTLLTLQTNV
jgi:hypothetical protein